MKSDIEKELEELKFEFKERIGKIENKYKNIRKLVPAILNKLNCDYLEFSLEEVNKNNSIYIVDYDWQSNKIIIQKLSDKSNEI